MWPNPILNWIIVGSYLGKKQSCILEPRHKTTFIFPKKEIWNVSPTWPPLGISSNLRGCNSSHVYSRSILEVLVGGRSFFKGVYQEPRRPSKSSHKTVDLERTEGSVGFFLEGFWVVKTSCKMRPRKLTWNPKNEDLEDVFSFSNGWFSGSMLNFGGVIERFGATSRFRSAHLTFTGWWQLKYFFIFTPIWGRFPFWLIFFRWVETNNYSLVSVFLYSFCKKPLRTHFPLPLHLGGLVYIATFD